MIVTLKTIADITAGQSPESSFYSTKSGTPFLQGNRTFGIKYPTIDTYTSKTIKIAKKGEVLMSVRAPVGDLNIANQDICIGRGLISLNAKDGDNEFLYYTLKSNIKNIINKSNGTTYDGITIDVIKNAKINIPENINTRKKVSKILSLIDEQIERNTGMVQKLQDLGNTIYSKMMSEEKEEVTLKKISKMYQPETITSDKFIPNGKYPVYGASGIIGYYDTFNCENSELMLSCRGVCGKAELSLPKSFIIGNQMIIQPNSNKYKYFLYNYFLNFDFSKIVTGSVQKQITRTNLEKIKLKIPKEITIEKYYSTLENIYTYKLNIVLKTINLIKFKEKILPLLINGQLEI